MFEKADLELQQPTLAKKDASPPNKKKSSRPRLWKAIYLYFSHIMSASLHKFAIANAREVHRARWDEVMVPDVENLVDWIKLFMVCEIRTRYPLSRIGGSGTLTRFRCVAEYYSQEPVRLGGFYGCFFGLVGQFRLLCFALLCDEQKERQIPVAHCGIDYSCWLRTGT